MRNSFKKLFMLLLTFLTLIVNAVGVTPAYADTHTVSSVADSGPGSLREAIAIADPNDIITFDAGLSGQTIFLDSTLTIEENLTIDGSSLSPQITISGDTNKDGTGDVRVFVVNANVTVVLDSLTITKGMGNTFALEYLAEGGGILNAGILTVTNSTLSYNTATVAGDHETGGAIANYGELTVTNTTFLNNRSTLIGGALYNGIVGIMTVANSTFSGNSADFWGGGIFNRGLLEMTNNTLSANSAGTTSDGGGLMNWDEGTLRFANNIIANSTSGGDCFNYLGAVVINTNNLVEDGSCSAALNGDPKLDVLASNGGPSQTMALLAHSPALGAGNPAACSGSPVNNFDQRGEVRPQGDTKCDIGAYESDLDGTLPAAPVVAAPVGFTTDTTPTISGTAEANSLVNVWYLDDSSALAQICTDVLVDGSGNWSCVSSATLPERTIQLTVNATDGAGNTSPNTLHTFSVDPTAPTAPIVTAPPAFTNDATPTISGTAEAGSLVNVWYLNDSSVLDQICTNVLVDGSGNWSCVPSVTLPERAIQLTVNATDGAGNTSPNTLHSFTIDFTYVTPPVVTAPIGSTSDTTPTISGTAEANSLVNVWYLDDSSVSVQICTEVLVDGSGNWSCVSPALPERAIELTVNAHDGAGNTSADTLHTFSVDLTAPVAPVVTAPVGLTNDTTPTISGTAEANSLVNVWYLDDSSVLDQICTDAPADGSGNWSCVSSVTLPVRAIELTAKATDGAGNISPSALHTFTIELTAPTVTSIVRVNPNPTKAAIVNFTVTFSEAVTGVAANDFMLSQTGTVNGASVQSVSGSDNVYTVTVNAGFGYGLLRLDVPNTATISDLAGNGLGNVPFTSGEAYTMIRKNGPDTTGVFRPSNGVIFLKNANTSGFAEIALNYGVGGDYPVVGDWDGNGTVTIGIYRNGSFYLRNSNTKGIADMVFAFGMPGDQPVAGDWDGDGDDTIGIYRPSTGQFLLRNSNSAGNPEMSFVLGNPGDVGIAGDWDGDGMDTTGVFRPSNGILFLKNTNSTGFAEIALNYGLPGDKPVTGDWDGNGTDTIGINRNGTFYLRNSNTKGIADMVFNLGNPGDMPIAGNWDGQP